MMSARIDTVAHDLKSILSEIFNTADENALELLYHCLTPIMADISVMRGVWLPEREAIVSAAAEAVEIFGDDELELYAKQREVGK